MSRIVDDFYDRLKSLMKENNLSRMQLVKEARAYLPEYSIPDIETAYKLAKYFNVSTDYLLGLSDEKTLSDVKTVDRDIKFICDYTGLNEEAVENIRKLVSVARDKEDVIRHLLTQTKFMIRVLE